MYLNKDDFVIGQIFGSNNCLEAFMNYKSKKQFNAMKKKMTKSMTSDKV